MRVGIDLRCAGLCRHQHLLMDLTFDTRLGSKIGHSALKALQDLAVSGDVWLLVACNANSQSGRDTAPRSVVGDLIGVLRNLVMYGIFPI